MEGELIDQNILQQKEQQQQQPSSKHSPFIIEKATTKDVTSILQLVNTAYRSIDAQQYGWTSEVDILDGPRVDEDAINEILDTPNATILMCYIIDNIVTNNDNSYNINSMYDNLSTKTTRKLVGCVELVQQKQQQQQNQDDTNNNDNKLYLGMLSVLPQYQNRGIGKQLLNASEEYGKSINCTIMRMTVLSIRTDLLHWYQKYGYEKTNESNILYKIPDDYRWGIPKQTRHQPLEFIILEKYIKVN